MAKFKSWLQTKLSPSEPRRSPGHGQTSAAYQRAANTGSSTTTVFSKSNTSTAYAGSTTTTVLQKPNKHANTSTHARHSIKLKAWAPKATEGLKTPPSASAVADKSFATDEQRAQSLIQYHGTAQKALVWAVERNHKRAIQCLLDRGVKDADPVNFSRCLSVVIGFDDKPLLLRLVDAARDSGDLLTLMRYPDFLYLVDQNVDPGTMTAMLGDLSVTGKDEVMCVAVEHGQNNVVRTLLTHDVDPNRCFNGGSILPMAVSKESGLVVDTLLLHHQTDVNAPGKTYAYQRGHVPAIKVAVTLKTDTLLKSILNGRSVDVNKKDSEGNTALHEAARLGSLNCVQHLLARGADPVAKNDKMQQAVHVAGELGHAACFNHFRTRIGLPAVTAQVFSKDPSSRSGPVNRQMDRRDVPIQNTLWPDRVIYDRRTGERRILPPSEPAYWY